MYSIELLRKMYDVCGYRLNTAMGYRIAGLGASELAHEMRESGPFGKSVKHSFQNQISFERKMWRAKSIAKLIAALPFVRGVAICNSLALHMSHEDSDIDFFIITAKDRVWSARWWVTGVLALLRLRPGEAMRDPICVSFFVDESVSDLSGVMLDDDIYFYFWLRSLLPVFGNHILFKDAGVLAPNFRVESKFLKKIQSILEFFAKFVPENFVHAQQISIMPKDLISASESKNSSVVLSEMMIKLHDQDRREEIRNAVFSNESL